MEEFKVGDLVKCIRDGASRGKGEKYFCGNTYKITHEWGKIDGTIGLKGFSNIVNKSDFVKVYYSVEYQIC